jgi:S1-C subfamily serine protease
MRQPESGVGGGPKSSPSVWIGRAAFAVAAAFGVLGYSALDASRRAAESELRDHRAALARVQADAKRRMTDVESIAQTALDDAARRAEAAEAALRSSAAALRRDIEAQGETLVTHRRLLDELDCRREHELDLARGDLQTKMDDLLARVNADREEALPTAARFRAVQRRADGGVFLVYCSFTYETKEDDEWTPRVATAWGTAFLASKDGLLVTNKHLVRPWKFDADLAALRAMGEARVLEDSVRIAAWPVGEAALDQQKNPLFANGFNTDRGDLAFVGEAPDRYVVRTAEGFRNSFSFETHALDDRDLAVLRIAGGPFEPLPLATESEERAIKKLDPVMTLGFPRGSSGLEGSIAESSASEGVVRKIENTIQVTAPIVAGNSGGPVLDVKGRVIGVATRIYSETLGICIRASRVRELLADVESRRPVAWSASIAPR